MLTIPAAVYSAFMFISAGLFARLMYRRNAAAAARSRPPNTTAISDRYPRRPTERRYHAALRGCSRPDSSPVAAPSGSSSAFWIVLAFAFSPLGAKLADETQDDTASFLPESAESTEVVELLDDALRRRRRPPRA